jgi:hypothetical protein
MKSLKSQEKFRAIYEIAADICAEWSKVDYAAKPYLDALLRLEDSDAMYGADTAETIALYFLSNAGSFRGPKAKTLKAELKRAVGVK